MTYNVSSGTLNLTHSLTHYCSTGGRFRQVVRDNVRSAQVPLESSGELRHLQAHDGPVAVAGVAVLLVVVPGDVLSARQTGDTTQQRGTGDLSR